MIKIRRKLLDNSPETTDFFMVLFQAFRYNPSAVVSLCLLARQYKLGYLILSHYASHQDVTSSHLTGFCKLACLLETPGFLSIFLLI